MKTKTQQKHNKISPQQIEREFFLQFGPPKSFPLLGFFVCAHALFNFHDAATSSTAKSCAYWILLAVLYAYVICGCFFRKFSLTISGGLRDWVPITIWLISITSFCLAKFLEPEGVEKTKEGIHFKGVKIKHISFHSLGVDSHTRLMDGTPT